MTGRSSKAFVWRAELVLEPDLDSREPGGAVTTHLCGRHDHDGPCRWPHNNEIEVNDQSARFRTVFACAETDLDEVAGRIRTALSSGAGWRIVDDGLGELTAAERSLGERLAKGS